MLELHSSVRFARDQKLDGGDPGPGLSALGRAGLVVHNGLYWFFLIPFLTDLSWRTGFAVYSAILFSRFLANSWINVRDLDWRAYRRYPLRIP